MRALVVARAVSHSDRDQRRLAAAEHGAELCREITRGAVAIEVREEVVEGHGPLLGLGCHSAYVTADRPDASEPEAD